MRYTDHSGAHRRHILNATDEKLNEAAEVLRHEIVDLMERSTPTGRIYYRGGNPSGLRWDSRAGQFRQAGGRFVSRKKVLSESHQASAPGEPPAIDSGDYAASWKVDPAKERRSRRSAAVYSDLKVGTRRKWILAILLEKGTERMRPRPHIRVALKTARARIMNILRSR